MNIAILWIIKLKYVSVSSFFYAWLFVIMTCLKGDYLDKGYWAVLNSCGAVYYAVQGGFTFLSLWMNSLSVTSYMKAIEQYKVVLTFEPVDEILKRNHSNES